MAPAEFDRFAGSYEQDLAKSLSATGEGRDYYAKARVNWTAHCLSRLNFQPQRVLDYGCGDGANAPIIAAGLQADSVVGVDVSSESIALAQQSNAGPGISFMTTREWSPDGSMDFAFCNGVFHHIPVVDRSASLAAIRRALHPGGLFAFWENNPWNPGTQYVMSQCAFDENAIKISPREAKRLLTSVGFKVLRADSLFYFPRALRFLRPAETWLRRLPLGGQYLVLCQRSP